MPVHYARILAVLVFALCGPAKAGQEGIDMKLSDFGFIMRPAMTPAQMQRLKLLPARTFVANRKNGHRYYLYADPDHCQCVFVGDEAAMQNYRAYVSPGPQAPMPLGPDGGPVAGSLIQEIDPGFPIIDGDIFDYPS
jgi:hypothetical protein